MQEHVPALQIVGIHLVIVIVLRTLHRRADRRHPRPGALARRHTRSAPDMTSAGSTPPRNTQR
ncbi:MAG: hypothetical protein EA398_12010 [Deltaproteobacteria bacterium]|nr:MAG: hypothetical protein EA398_12010 [Deltaproteobacteria bacterium]